MGEDPRSGTLADFLAFIWRHRVLVVGGTALVAVASVIYVLVVPVRYTARASLLPQDSSGSGLLGAAMAMAGGGLGNLSLPGLTSGESEIQEAILKSERVAERIRAEFDLDTVWKTRSRDRFLRRWYGSLSIATNRENLLVVGFQDRDPERATAIVGRLLELLDEVNRDIRTSSGRRTRDFLEGRVDAVRKRMTALEDSLAVYQVDNRGMALTPEADGAAGVGAQLLVQRLRLEADASVMRRSLGPEAPALKAMEMQIEALDAELARLPGLNSDMARILRDLRIHERTFALLAAQVEEARLQEARDIPTVDVLDPPRVPDVKSWPMRTFTVLGAVAAAGVLTLLLARLLDAWGEVRRRLEADGD